VGHHHRPHYNTGDPKPHSSPAPNEKSQEASTGQQQPNTERKPSEKRVWGMTTSERIMAALTLIGLVALGPGAF
jgi:hypothetical protein